MFVRTTPIRLRVPLSILLAVGVFSGSCGGASGIKSKTAPDAGKGSETGGGGSQHAQGGSAGGGGAGGNGGSGIRVCIPGEEQGCLCPGGWTGIQTCGAAGDGFGLCTGCPETNGPDSSVGVDGPGFDAGAGGQGGQDGAGGAGGGSSLGDAGYDDATDRGETGASCITNWPMPNSWQLSPDAGPPPINPQSYDTSQVGVVVDNVTGLMWQHPINTILGRDWDGAKAYCSGLRLSGFSDWRLPTRIELVSILDVSKHSPAINLIAFPDTSTVAFWTSSKEVRSTDPWIVSFISGSTLKYSIGYTVLTRCVRSSRVPASAPCYTFDTDTVYDVQTKLTWQRKPPSTRRVWASAVEYCATLALNGGGWRLPTPQELQTLGDDTRPNFMSNPVAFPDPSPGVFFAASRYAGGSAGAWRVNFTNGTAQGGYPADQAAQVRCVR